MAPMIFGASTIGPSHVEEGRPLQDHHLWWISEEGLAVIAVADGLGSAKRSDTGAKTSVSAAVEHIKAEHHNGHSLPSLAMGAVTHARSALEHLVEGDSKLRDFGCTLIVAVAKGPNISVAHVGDGWVVGMRAEGLTVLSAPEESEYINEVTPLSTGKWREAIRQSPTFDDVESVAILTDGCQAGCFVRHGQQTKPSPDFFGPLLKYGSTVGSAEEGSTEVGKLLASDDFSAASEDDKTLVVALLSEPSVTEKE